jgi:DNA topoisomerase-1
MKTPHHLTIDETRESVQKPPRPLNTSTLLQQASLQLNMRPKQTMLFAQQLYQDGHITYMRTESTVVSNQFKQLARSFVKSKYGDAYLNQDVPTNASSLPHEAIRCTHIENRATMGDDAKGRLYALIWRHSLYHTMSNAITYVTKMEMNPATPYHTPPTTPSTITHYKWQTQIEIPGFKGWRILDNTKSTPPPPHPDKFRPEK